MDETASFIKFDKDDYEQTDMSETIDSRVAEFNKRISKVCK